MCGLSRALFFSLFLLLFCLVSAWSQDSEQGTPLPGPDSSAFSSELSSTEKMPELPAMVAPQLDPQMTLEEKQAAMLEAWIAWSRQVTISWKQAKTSYENLDQRRLDQIAILKKKGEQLEKEIRHLRLKNWVYGIAGGVIGGIAGKLSNY